LRTRKKHRPKDNNKIKGNHTRGTNGKKNATQRNCTGNRSNRSRCWNCRYYGNNRHEKTEETGASEGIAHIRATFNNTLINITDMKGNIIAWNSPGKSGFKGSRKNSPFAAGIAAEVVGKLAYDAGVRSVEVHLKGAGTVAKAPFGRLPRQASKYRQSRILRRFRITVADPRSDGECNAADNLLMVVQSTKVSDISSIERFEESTWLFIMVHDVNYAAAKA